MFYLTTGLPFVVTALAEIVGCFLPYLQLRKGGRAWLLLPAEVSLALFAWLLTLHPSASGRIYAAQGGVYVATALVWLRVVDGVKLSTNDYAGAGIVLLGMGVIVMGWRAAQVSNLLQLWHTVRRRLQSSRNFSSGHLHAFYRFFQ